MKRLFAFLILLSFLAGGFVIAGAGDMSTQELLEALKNTDAKKRREAAEELGERQEKMALPHLENVTNDTDPKVQLAAIKAISQITDPRTISALSHAVRTTKGDVQKAAMHHLIRYYIPPEDKNALEELFVSIEDLFSPSHPIVAEPWIRVDEEAVDALLFVLDDKQSANRIQAAANLGILRVNRALPRLRYYLRSPNQQMVRTVVRSIGYVGNPAAGADLIPMLKVEDKQVVMDAARVLGQFRYKEALPELIHFLDYSNKDEYKKVALQAISRIGDPSSEQIMLKYLNDDDDLMRLYAIEGLGRMKASKHTEVLELQVLKEKNDAQKLALSFSLYQFGREAHVDPLVRALGDKMRKVQARGYFIELGDRAVDDVAKYLDEAEKEFKIRLIRMLGDMHRPRAIELIEPYLKDRDLEIARAATDAVRELKMVSSTS